MKLYQFFLGLLMTLAGMVAMAADLPLYVRFIPFAPPNLYLEPTRNPTNAFYIPSMNAGVTHNFTQTPAVGGTLSLAEGPIPITIMAFNGQVNCPGVKTVTVAIDYSIGGVVTVVGTQTQDINVTAGGAIVQSFAFNGISAANSAVLGAGDFVRMRVTSAQTRLCLVNEFPIGGTDTDASRAIFQTGPILSIDKTFAVIQDPINGLVNPKSVPGATVRYTMTVTNATNASADGDAVIVSDPMPADTTYVPGSMTLDTVAQTDADDAPTDDSDFNLTTANAITIDLGTVAPNTTHTITFDVTVD